MFIPKRLNIIAQYFILFGGLGRVNMLNGTCCLCGHRLSSAFRNKKASPLDQRMAQTKTTHIHTRTHATLSHTHTHTRVWAWNATSFDERLKMVASAVGKINTNMREAVSLSVCPLR
jgi:hypothetical protein